MHIGLREKTTKIGELRLPFFALMLLKPVMLSREPKRVGAVAGASLISIPCYAGKLDL